MIGAPKAGEAFRLYIAAQERVIGRVLTQQENGKELVVAYLSRRLVDAETRYAFVEKLCLSLYHACTKLRHYLLSSTCTVACQHDVVKFMIQKPMLQGRVGKWIYSLIEYDLDYEPLWAVKGQVIMDFVVDYEVSLEEGVIIIELRAWVLHFYGSVCSRGQGIGCVIVSPSGEEYSLSAGLGFECTDNQVEYEALLYGLEYLFEVGDRDIEVYGDSKLVVQKVSGECQCLDGVLNRYRERCLEIIRHLDIFRISYMLREKNGDANMLAQWASRYEVTKGWFSIKKRLAS
jgi:ribonuclease HI